MEKLMNEMTGKHSHGSSIVTVHGDVRDGGKRRVDVVQAEPSDFQRTVRRAPLSSALTRSHDACSPAIELVFCPTPPPVYKSLVPESNRSWDVAFINYNPVVYTSPEVLNDPFADTDILSMLVTSSFFCRKNYKISYVT